MSTQTTSHVNILETMCTRGLMNHRRWGRSWKLVYGETTRWDRRRMPAFDDSAVR